MPCLDLTWRAPLLPDQWISHIQRHSTRREGRGQLGVFQACVWVPSQIVCLFGGGEPIHPWAGGMERRS